jgi:hypothetical protein
MSGWVGRGVAMPFPGGLVEEGIGVGLEAVEDGCSVGGGVDDTTDLRVVTTKEDTVGLIEVLDSWVVDVRPWDEVATCGASERASTQ